MLNKLYTRLQRITTNHVYFPEIDGIRFLAIILVILFHTHGYFLEKVQRTFTDKPGGYPLIDNLLYHGDHGVQLFFVLSGFILCLPFAHHYINHGKKVSLKRYYLRRVTRLEPPYFIAMIALFLVSLVMKVYTFSFLFPSLLASLVYLHNIIFQHTPYITVVAWSLEIEIQYYLLAPILFRVLLLPKIVRRILLVFASLMFVWLQHTYPMKIDSIYNYAQFFLSGILLADLYVSGDGEVFIKHKVWGIVAILMLAGILYLSVKENLYAAMLFPLMITTLYIIILKNEQLKSIFSYKFIPIIGGMCYSIYLLHYPIISAFGRLTMKLSIGNYYLPNLFLQIILLLIPILSISSIYYFYVERPFMSSKWMDKLMGKEKKDT